MLAAESDLPSLPILEGCRRLLSPLEVFVVSAVLAMEYDGVDGVTVARAVGVIESSHEAQTAGLHFFQYATSYLSQCLGERVQKGAESCGDGYGLVAPWYIMDGYACCTSKADPGARGSSIHGGIFYVTTMLFVWMMFW